MTHILLVEDDKGLQGILMMHLKKAGYEVTACDDYFEAEAALDDGLRPDLTLTDFNYPGENGDTGGLDTVKKMRQVDPAIPVLLMSAAARDLPNDITERFSNRDEIIEKPARPENCVRMVAQYLAKPTA